MRGPSIRPTLCTIVAGLLAFGACDPRRSVEPGATTAISRSEIPGQHSPDDLDPITAQRFVDHVRLGRDVDSAGQVPRHMVASTFSSGSPIYVSLEVSDAPAGSLVRVDVLDLSATAPVWSDQKSVADGNAYLSFKVDDRLPSGSYRAQVTIGDETVARREFEIVVES